MLRLRNERTGQAPPIKPTRHGQLATYVASCATSDPSGMDALRALILADLIGRVARQHGLRVWAWHNTPGGRPAAWTTFNIYPAEYAPRPPDPLDIGIGSAEAEAGVGAAPASVWVRPGRILAPFPILSLDGLDPLAFRLAVLWARYAEQLQLTPDDLTAADQELREWRAEVAGWATYPSRPMCAQHLAEITDAFDDDLDTPTAIATLRALAWDAEIPPGSKFETFAHLDQILGLDLARDVGR